MIFKYKIINDKGITSRGSIEAENKESLYMDFRKSNCYVLNLKKIRTKYKKNKKISYKELSDICYSMAELMKSGLDISRVLEVLKEDLKNPLLKESFAMISEELLQGKSVYEGFNKFNYLFPEIFLNFIMVGEKSGDMDDIFINMSEYYENIYYMEERIKKSLRYPLIVIITAVIIITVIINFSMPTFVNTITNMGGNPPKLLKNIMGVNKFMLENIQSIIPIILIIVLVFIRKIKTSDTSKILLKTPLIKEFIRLNTVLNIIVTMKVLFVAGLDIISTMEIIIKGVKNSYIKEKLINTVINMRSGLSITKSFSSLEIFDNTALSMIRIGEETGELDKSLAVIAKRTKESLERFIDKTIGFLQPFCILILAIITVVIILSVMYPMIEMMSTL